MIIRPAEQSDADALVAIANPIIAETTITFSSTLRTRRSMRAYIAARRETFFVAETGGEVTGYATCAPFRSGSGYVRTFEHTILLAPGARGQGQGRALMEALTQCLVPQGAGSLVGAISAENAQGIDFHAALGFTQVGRIPSAGWKFDRWIDLVLMQKMLTASA
ncbi:GNAT family acetyltransferase [Roseivivax halodurans JCM 10272]|uniref:GNAT family acetyltransferase n=1 Tax=Roseivivax halodurans JCM 10272 TaxID=1449350 RepID=X7EN64_9RHOB|nr:GNAT family N-acetyltransferase [Roseivivax halodurans]ETX16636.1 GNAT family acetyltransferase [Roseivivax halodurans JCM 10272]